MMVKKVLAVVKVLLLAEKGLAVSVSVEDRRLPISQWCPDQIALDGDVLAV